MEATDVLLTRLGGRLPFLRIPPSVPIPVIPRGRTLVRLACWSNLFRQNVMLRRCPAFSTNSRNKGSRSRISTAPELRSIWKRLWRAGFALRSRRANRSAVCHTRRSSLDSSFDCPTALYLRNQSQNRIRRREYHERRPL